MWEKVKERKIRLLLRVSKTVWDTSYTNWERSEMLDVWHSRWKTSLMGFSSELHSERNWQWMRIQQSLPSFLAKDAVQQIRVDTFPVGDRFACRDSCKTWAKKMTMQIKIFWQYFWLVCYIIFIKRIAFKIGIIFGWQCLMFLASPKGICYKYYGKLFVWC